MDDRSASPHRPRRRRRRDNPRKVLIGKRAVFTQGLAPSLWNDFYHGAMTVGWPGFLFGLAAVYVLINAVFAWFYALAPDGVANSGGRLLQLFYFSVETLTTVGYGEMFPQSDYAHSIVSVETFVGLFFSASMLGLIFARVSRPRARLIFTKFLTVGPYDGQRMLFMRVANARLNMISSATARLWLLVQETSVENNSFRRFLELKLVRSENPTFVLSWTIMHAIDETSPLYSLSPDDLREKDAFLILAISGHDETSAQTVHARETYFADHILWDHRFADILSKTDDGSTLLDYDLFHDVVPISRRHDAAEQEDASLTEN